MDIDPDEVALLLEVLAGVMHDDEAVFKYVEAVTFCL